MPYFNSEKDTIATEPVATCIILQFVYYIWKCTILTVHVIMCVSQTKRINEKKKRTNESSLVHFVKLAEHFWVSQTSFLIYIVENSW